MTLKYLVDTNVLVYAYDCSQSGKQSRALEVLDWVVTAGSGAVSTQVLAEFFVAVTRKIAPPLTVREAYDRVRNLLRVWTVLEVTGLVVLEAARGARDHQLSCWDAQIWATARLNQIPLVFSEDFSDGTVIEGIQFVDPFREGFDLKWWKSR